MPSEVTADGNCGGEYVGLKKIIRGLRHARSHRQSYRCEILVNKVVLRLPAAVRVQVEAHRGPRKIISPIRNTMHKDLWTSQWTVPMVLELTLFRKSDDGKLKSKECSVKFVDAGCPQNILGETAFDLAEVAACSQKSKTFNLPLHRCLDPAASVTISVALTTIENVVVSPTALSVMDKSSRSLSTSNLQLGDRMALSETQAPFGTAQRRHSVRRLAAPEGREISASFRPPVQEKSLICEGETLPMFRSGLPQWLGQPVMGAPFDSSETCESLPMSNASEDMMNTSKEEGMKCLNGRRSAPAVAKAAALSPMKDAAGLRQIASKIDGDAATRTGNPFSPYDGERGWRCERSRLEAKIKELEVRNCELKSELERAQKEYEEMREGFENELMGMAQEVKVLKSGHEFRSELASETVTLVYSPEDTSAEAQYIHLTKQELIAKIKRLEAQAFAKNGGSRLVELEEELIAAKVHLAEVETERELTINGAKKEAAQLQSELQNILHSNLELEARLSKVKVARLQKLVPPRRASSFVKSKLHAAKRIQSSLKKSISDIGTKIQQQQSS